MGTASASAAKISRPKVAGIYPRVRLFEQLDRLDGTPITWITSPPGAGKTTLVSSYIDARGLDTLWYQVDEDDAEASTFFYFMGQAARKATPRRRRELPVLTPEYQQGIATFTRNFFRLLFERFAGRFFIVLDNFQELAEDAALHAILATGLSELPEQGRVIIISRAEPPSNYARLRANNDIRELNWDQLALSEHELGAVLKLKGRTELPLASAMAITQGWIAGLVLLLEHEEQAWSGGPVEQFNPKILFDYFAGEVYGRTDAETQRFLIKTALLPRMTAGMAVRLTGVHDAAEILNRLADRNYFIHRHPGRTVEYQYHPLFLEFLSRKAEESLTEVELTTARWRAAEILSGAGETEAAVDLLFKVRDWKQIARLVEGAAEPVLRQGRYQTLERWLEQLPEDQVRASPWLCFWMGMVKRPVNPTLAYAWFRDALAGFRHGGDVNGIYRSWGMAVRTSREAARSTIVEFEEWDRVLGDLMREYPVFPSADAEAIVAMGMYDIITWGMPSHPDKAFWKKRYEELLSEVADPLSRLEMLIYGGICDCLASEHVLAGQRLAAAERMLDAATPTMFQSMLHLLRPFFLWRDDRNREAVDAALAALRFADETGVHIWDEHYVAHGLTAALKDDNLEMADRLVERGMQLIDVSEGFRSAHLHYSYGWYLFRKGELHKAEQVVEQGLSRARQSRVPYFCGISLFAQAVIHYALGRHTEAEASLRESLDVARKGEFWSSILQCAVEAAYIRIRSKDERRATELLREGLQVARTHDGMTFSWWRNEVWEVVAPFALQHGIEIEYVRQIIRRNRIAPDPPPVDVDDWPWAVRIHCFGRSELIVDDAPVRFSRKAQKKPMQLVRAVVAMGGVNVPESRIIEALWPDAEGDAAHTAFATTLHRVRKLLGAEHVRLHEGRVSLDRHYVWTDVWAFERLNERINSLGPAAGMERRGKLLERVLDLYKGHFLADEADSNWALMTREKLRTIFLQDLEDFGRLLEREQHWEKAIRWYRRGLEVDMLAEQFYQRIMYCYLRTDRRADAAEAYRQCCRVLLASLNVSPSARTRELFREINE